MFPIRDVSGRVIGFSGRILKEDPAREEAKYLNSPETPVFEKSRAMYGIYEARDGMRSLNSALLVEGQMDLLMAHQAGYRNAVATSGTAFTQGHADMISRYTKNLLIAYDGDRAGVSAAGRAAAIALPAGMNVKVAAFPAGEDPADVIKKDPEAFKSAIREGVHIVDFYLTYLKDAKYDPRTFRLEVSRTVLPYIALIPNKIDQAHFVKRVSEALSVPEDAVLEEVKKIQKGADKKPGASSASALPPAEPFLSRADNLERLTLGFLLLFTEKGDTEAVSRAEEVLKESVGADRLELIRRNTDETRAAVFEADVFLSEHPEDARMQAVSDVYADLAREARHEKYRDALSRLRMAEKSGDEAASESLMSELSSLARTLQ
jgi:DNA primase